LALRFQDNDDIDREVTDERRASLFLYLFVFASLAATDGVVSWVSPKAFTRTKGTWQSYLQSLRCCESFARPIRAIRRPKPLPITKRWVAQATRGCEGLAWCRSSLSVAGHPMGWRSAPGRYVDRPFTRFTISSEISTSSPGEIIIMDMSSGTEVHYSHAAAEELFNLMAHALGKAIDPTVGPRNTSWHG
jgi:hypothetical protein